MSFGDTNLDEGGEGGGRGRPNYDYFNCLCSEVNVHFILSWSKVLYGERSGKVKGEGKDKKEEEEEEENVPVIV